jgi:hypothetical protein
MEVSGQLHAPAELSAGKQLQIPIVYEIRWGPQSLSERYEEKNLFLLPETESLPLGRQASSLH